LFYFIENFEGFNFEEEPYYTENIWSKEEEKPATLNGLKSIQEEIEALRADIREKELLISKLENKTAKD
jgi:hypothetical protein